MSSLKHDTSSSFVYKCWKLLNIICSHFQTQLYQCKICILNICRTPVPIKNALLFNLILQKQVQAITEESLWRGLQPLIRENNLKCGIQNGLECCKLMKENIIIVLKFENPSVTIYTYILPGFSSTFSRNFSSHAQTFQVSQICLCICLLFPWVLFWVNICDRACLVQQ